MDFWCSLSKKKQKCSGGGVGGKAIEMWYDGGGAMVERKQLKSGGGGEGETLEMWW